MEKKLLLLAVWFWIGMFLVTAQERRVTGVVISEDDNEPVIGATVLVVGSQAGTVTDIDGTFSIPDLPSSAKMLRVSYVGMITQDVEIKPNMRIVLKSDAHLLGEVVITGMQQMDKRMFTGATTKLSSDDVKMDGMPDISRALEGRVAGVSVQNVSGTFGTAPKIRVRGATSIYGNSKPLWVVDGIIMEDVTEVSADDLSSGDAVTLVSSAIAGLNADDIESFQILKDGSATSIYGARAMAGVIVVTTKKGKSGVHRINYTGEYTMRAIPNYGNFNIMNSQEQMGIYKEMESKGWLNYANTYRATSSGIYGKMYQLLSTYDPVTQTWGLENTIEAKNRYLQDAELRNTNWFQELFSNSIQQLHSVGISSGSDKLTFYASLSALVDPGWSVQSKVNRYTANLNTTYNILKNLSINMIASGSYRTQRAPGAMAQEVDPVFGEVKRAFDINPYGYALTASRALDANTFYRRNYADFNIMRELDNNYMEINGANLKFQAEMKWRVIPGLELSALGAIKYDGNSTEHNILDNSNQAMAYRAMDDATIMEQNPYLYLDPEKLYSLPITILPEGGIYQRTDYRMNGYDFRGMVNFVREWNDAHVVNFAGGMEMNSFDRRKTWFAGWGLQYSLGAMPYYIYQYFKKGIEGGNDYYSLDNVRSRRIGFFANPTYSYKRRYTLTGTVRYDGSNRLGQSRTARWLPTWNVGLSWNAHEEKFIQQLKPVLSHMTIRSSYSLTGESGPDFVNNSQLIINSFTPWRPSSDAKEPGLQVADPEINFFGFINKDLTYEKKYEFNVGTDLGFLDNRLNLTMDWYTRDNHDLIGITYTQVLGMKYGNVASMKSSGVEFAVSTKNITNKDFTWDTNITFSKNKVKITELNSVSTVMQLVKGQGFAVEGYPNRALFSIPFMGLNNEGIPTFLNQDGEITTWDINFQEVNKLDFLKYEGPIDPTVTGSLGNIFKYRDFRLNLFVTYSFGNVIRLAQAFKAYYNDLASMPKEFKNRWTVPGDEAYTNIPVILNKWQYEDNTYLRTGYNAYNFSDQRVAKGDFIRLKEVSLSYDFPERLRPQMFNQLSLKMQATNLFLLYADKKLNGNDPEFYPSGGVAVPVPRQFTLTLRLGL